MFDNKKSFQNKKIKQVETKKRKKNISFFKDNLKWFLSLWIVVIIIYFWSSISLVFWNYLKSITWSVVKTVAKTMWKKANTDSIWNVNVLILWVGWKNHDGAYLTDSMMIASFNPRLKTVTFLSIPRDLYVKYPWGGGWRLNYIFARTYLKTGSFDKAAYELEKKIKQITWIKINYYVMVDFGWFEKFIDKMWGITIDVPKTLVDYRYPGPNWTYTTFKITKWIHHLDGKTALKYARSRHSTSDFSRSARQEQIIKAIINKLKSSWTLTSPSKLKLLYMQFKETVKTDFDFETLLSFIPYVKWIKIHSYVLNADCYFKPTNWSNLTPWCFLYPAERAAFNWQAVLLPVWSTPKNVENYDKIQKFAFIVLWYPELWLENSKIQILNWISKKKIKRYYRWYLKPLASKLAYKLKNYWFNVKEVKNADKTVEKTVSYVYKEKKITQELIKTFVWSIVYKKWDVSYSWNWFDMTIVLWNDYLK